MADDFYETIPALDNFADAVRVENYSPLPDDWVVGFADVAGSTKAVADGRYKAVNMVGAGAIAAVANALDRRPFPFVFGGDGASFAVSSSDAALAAKALQAMAAFARKEFHLELRVAMAPVGEIRMAGYDVRVARFAAAPACVYAMFTGGGLTWFDAAAKSGAYALPLAELGARPDLSGLSCRWGVAPAKHGLVLSLIVAPRGNDARFAPLINEIVKSSLAVASSERPVTLTSLRPGNPGRAIALETRVKKASGLRQAKARVAAIRSYCIAIFLHTFKLKVGQFDAATYAGELVANADFRKFDDGLRMTLDCSPEFADALEARLAAADAFVHWGVFRQAAAQVTCFVPSATQRGHVHFVDGAGGGYTMAAKAMKARRDAFGTAASDLGLEGRHKEGSMGSAFRSTVAIAIGLAAAFGGQRARADVAPPPPATLAVLSLDYVDTSGEPTDQTAVHQRRAADFVSALQRDLAANGQYRIVSMSCGSESCAPLTNPSELQKAARAAGAKLVLLGGVHKMSTLVQWAKIQIADEERGQVVFDRLLTFRGDTDEAWQKAESFVARDVLNSTPTFGKQGDALAPVKLAVFDFELEDFSGGAGVIPESDEDREQLRRATETARQLLIDSGRYSLVDVSRADAPDATAHSLHKCDGCDAVIARQLGADQSLVGIVSRITRTDYAVTFKIRDARTGAAIAVEQTDLRIGANYSWNRGAAWLIKNRLLEKHAQQ